MPHVTHSPRPRHHGPSLLPLLLLVLALTLPGCAGKDGRAQARDIAAAGGFSPVALEAGDFVLRGWTRPGSGSVLHVYIEGDGAAWKSRSVPSSDPTPRRPTAFRLAAADSARGPVLYLGRPCQYTTGAERRGCEVRYWTGARYSEPVLRSLETAIREVMRRTSTSRVALYGFSGGGALAALLAGRGMDTVFIGTAAANLGTAAWTAHHGVSPLTGSLDPADSKDRTAGIRQVHLSGEDDSVCPPFLAREWCVDLPGCEQVLVPGIGHGGAWEDVWEREMCRRRDGR